ncbi:acetylcholine receptor subunit alpha-1-A-like [Mya arenaria]|uniref:acetylcholine receptor subunit alpha-1-A-like n=1 Tax=Mya arenaria TaxID=6604 RepID=UPI0022E50DC1|nr:acetylcholine receptor subunit alpha-1-A-like [Mya arenaria]
MYIFNAIDTDFNIPFDQVQQVQDTIDRQGRSQFQTMFLDIMKNYSKNLLPTLGARFQQMKLNITTQIETLVGIDEVEERFTTVLTFHLAWEDKRLTWDPLLSGVPFMTIDENVVWKPVIEIGNPHEAKSSRKETENLVYIMSDGRIYWTFVRTIDTRCDIDTTHYPFDRQYCHIDLTTPMYTLYAVNFTHGIHKRGLNHGNWRYHSHSIYRHQNVESFLWIGTIEYAFDRKPTNPVILYIAPVFILISILPLVFLLPNEGSDRIGLTLTVLLAVSVYMTLVADELPDRSEPMPIITIVLFIWYVLNTLTTMLVILNARMYRISEQYTVPACLQCAVLFTRRIFCQGQLKAPVEDEDDSQQEAITNEVNDEEKGNAMPGNDNISSAIPGRGDVTSPNVNWKHVSSMVDKILIVSIYTVMAIFLSILFGVLYHGDKNKKSSMEFGDEYVKYDINAYNV